MGASASGARDANAFYNSVGMQGHGFLPSLSSITYSGVFADHFFNTGAIPEDILSCDINTGSVKDPFSGKEDLYMAVGLNSKYDGQGMKEFKRPPLNLVVCLDVSGSMSAGFSMGSASKMEIAKASLINLLDHLRVGIDRFGLVTFNTESKCIHPLSLWEEGEREELVAKISKIQAGGGTDMELGMVLSQELFQDSLQSDDADVESRIMFFTDAMPNVGRSDKSLSTYTEENSKKKLFTTFIGVGLDFNAGLVEELTRPIGANYLTVKSEEDFKRVLSEDFEYIVFPCAFHVSLWINPSSKTSEEAPPSPSPLRVYGSPGFEIPNQDGLIMRVSTILPSQKQGRDGTKGGVVLVLFSREEGQSADFSLNLQYSDRSGLIHTKTIEVQDPFPSFEGEELNPRQASLTKAVTLVSFVNLCRHWIYDTHTITEKGNEDQEYNCSVGEMIGIPPFPLAKLEENLTQGKALYVSAGYKEHFARFAIHLEEITKQIKDDSFDKELEVVQRNRDFDDKKTAGTTEQ